ncbi:MAG: arginine--tRNA ligase [Clostridia bacterium]|nr:arginine--tRNA ligase [Clostridia bacterium]
MARKAPAGRRPLFEARRDIEARVREAVAALLAEAAPAHEDPPAFTVEVPARREHGDFATNAALVLARPLGRPPREVALALLPKIRGGFPLARTEVAGPGFLNFFLDPSWLDEAADLARLPDWGESRAGAGERVVVEFVSANPTGPLNVVNARAAAYGDALCRVLSAAGWEVTREYYVNDAGNQFERFAESVAVRWAEIYEGRRDLSIPQGGYPGAYVYDLARRATEALAAEGLPAERLSRLPERERAEKLGRAALEAVLRDHREALRRFRVEFDRWARESDLRAEGAAETAFRRLVESGHTYESEGAVWLRTTAFGDDRDRVLRRKDGTFTYIVPDIAYHLDKLERAERAIDLLGPDHHGYLARLRAALAALGRDPSRLEFLVSQAVHLVRGGDRLKMSKREGEFVTMSEFLDEVDVDAARWFFVARSFDSPLEFDLDLAGLESDENPVYYVQYAHARIASLLGRAEAEGAWPPPGSEETPDAVGATERPAGGSRFPDPAEAALLRAVARFPEEVAIAAEERAPHRLTAYALELAQAFHAFYTECRVLDAGDPARRTARLLLTDAARNTLARALALLGVTAPERM